MSPDPTLSPMQLHLIIVHRFDHDAVQKSQATLEDIHKFEHARHGDHAHVPRSRPY